MSIDFECLTKVEADLARSIIGDHDFGDNCYVPKSWHDGSALLDGYFDLADLKLILLVEEALARNSSLD
jgi:hypothetical protein